MSGTVRDAVLVETLQQVGSGLGLASVTFVLLSPVSNVPAVVLLLTVVSDPTGWYLLTVSTLAENMTPIASAVMLKVSFNHISYLAFEWRYLTDSKGF